MDQESPMVTVVPGELKAVAAYRLLLSSVVPRPIAWVSTLSPDGAPNLAPYSFFNGVNGVPPVIMFAAARTRNQGEKDTLRNIRATKQFVVNLVHEGLAERMNVSSGEWPADVDEFQKAGLAPAPSTDVSPPRVDAAPLAMEAVLHDLIPVKETASVIVLGRVLRFHIQKQLLRKNGLVDAELMRPLARLGGDEYGTLGRVFRMPRPRV